MTDDAVPVPEATAELPPDPDVAAGEVEHLGDASDPGGRLQEHLLDRLLYKGVLPRYAFPTDVATFYVFDKVNSSSYRAEFIYSPSQGLPVALSQYAPGKDVFIGGSRYRSGAIYSPFKGDMKYAWDRKRLYYECSTCEHGATHSYRAEARGDELDCPRCSATASFGPAKTWIRPPGFAHPVCWDEETSPTDQPPPSRPSRAKLSTSSPSEGMKWRAVSDRLSVVGDRQMLLVTNSGPRREGYLYCTGCGRIEPMVGVAHSLLDAHAKPFPDDKDPQCPGFTARKVVLGVDFMTDILLLAMRVEPPVRLTPENLATRIALRTACEALVRSTTTVLELEPGELEADFRAVPANDGTRGLGAEIYLYDTLPGGAGLARQAADRIEEILDSALNLLEGCDCDTSCYQCLRGFRNKYDHDRLDRLLGAGLLRHILRGELPHLDGVRREDATRVLALDLRRQLGDAYRVDEDVQLDVPGIGSVLVPILIQDQAMGRPTVVCVAHPLTPGIPPDDALTEMAEFSATEVRVVSELLVRRALPHTTSQILKSFDPPGI